MKGDFFMKSFCIKENNNLILDYLLSEFKNLGLENVTISKNVFKYYSNIIVHYKGKEECLFVYKFSEIITDCIINFYEKNIVKKIINNDFFYFDAKEKVKIFENCLELLHNKDSNEYLLRKEKVFKCVYEYVLENKFFILNGFVNFRLFEYNALLAEIVDTGVNQFVIDKEYNEFIGLLQSYIVSQKCKHDLIHVIYNGIEPILLNDNQQVVNYGNELENHKFLSDISFSSNDYCLNALLNLLPKRIIVHVIGEEDEFLETLKLIFGGRIMICKECNICRTFGVLNLKKGL